MHEDEYKTYLVDNTIAAFKRAVDSLDETDRLIYIHRTLSKMKTIIHELREQNDSE